MSRVREALVALCISWKRKLTLQTIVHGRPFVGFTSEFFSIHSAAISILAMAYLHCRTWTRIPFRVRISISKMVTVTIEDLNPDRNLNPSQCNVAMFCTAQCSHWVWNPNTSQYLNLCPAKKSHSTNFLAYIKGSFILERKRTRKRHRF